MLRPLQVLSPSGIYYGRLDLDPGISDPVDHLIKHQLLPAAVLHLPGQPVPAAAADAAERPLSLVGAACCLSLCVVVFCSAV